MVMFMGEYRHNLDSKNRLIIPAKFRDQLSTSVYVTEWMDGCLAAYTEEKWGEMVMKLNKLPKTNAAARAFVRHITGKAVREEFYCLSFKLMIQKSSRIVSL